MLLDMGKPIVSIKKAGIENKRNETRCKVLQRVEVKEILTL